MYIRKKSAIIISIIVAAFGASSLLVAHLASSAKFNYRNTNENMSTDENAANSTIGAAPQDITGTTNGNTASSVSEPPFEPSEDDIESLVALGFSQKDAIFICQYNDIATIGLSDDSWLKQHAIERANIVKAQMEEPNAYLANQDPVAYLQTRGYTLEQAQYLVKNWVENAAQVLTGTNVDFDEYLHIGHLK